MLATPAEPRALTMLNQLGDITIAWSADDDERMTEIIRAKMKAGVTFFIIAPRVGPADLPQAGKALKRPGDAKRHRALMVADKDLAAFLETAPTAAAIKTPPAAVAKTRISRDPSEVARSQSVGVQAARGG